MANERTGTDADSSEWLPNGPATDQELIELVGAVGQLPRDYLDFLGISNGGEGFLGTSYLVLWEAKDLPRYNDAYETATYAPGFLIFGSDGGGEAFGFDTRGSKYSVVRLPFVGMDWDDAILVSDNFSGFLNLVKAG